MRTLGNYREEPNAHLVDPKSGLDFTIHLEEYNPDASGIGQIVLFVLLRNASQRNYEGIPSDRLILITTAKRKIAPDEEAKQQYIRDRMQLVPSDERCKLRYAIENGRSQRMIVVFRLPMAEVNPYPVLVIRDGASGRSVKLLAKMKFPRTNAWATSKSSNTSKVDNAQKRER